MKDTILLKTFGTILIKHIFERALKGHLNANDAVLSFFSSMKVLWLKNDSYSDEEKRDRDRYRYSMRFEKDIIEFIP